MLNASDSDYIKLNILQTFTFFAKKEAPFWANNQNVIYFWMFAGCSLFSENLIFPAFPGEFQASLRGRAFQT